MNTYTSSNLNKIKSWAIRYYTRLKIFIILAVAMFLVSRIPYLNIILLGSIRIYFLFIVAVYLFHIKGNMLIIVGLVLFPFAYIALIAQKIILAESIGDFIYVVFFIGTIRLFYQHLRSTLKNEE